MENAKNACGRTFDAIETEHVLTDIEGLLEALEIIHRTFHDCNDLEGVRRGCRALDPVIAMTIAETAKLRATLFPGGPHHVDS